MQRAKALLFLSYLYETSMFKYMRVHMYNLMKFDDVTCSCSCMTDELDSYAVLMHTHSQITFQPCTKC